MSVAPVIARVEPIAGESLLSLITRTAAANVFPNLAPLLRTVRVEGHPAFVPFTATDHAPALAQLLGVELCAITARLHPLHPDQTITGAVIWAGTRVRRRSIEARRRRIAPLALQTSPHHRLEWTHRGLSFCPETFQTLIWDCPVCRASLGWAKTWGPDRCEHCRALLTESPSPLVSAELQIRLAAACRLVSSDREIRTAARSQLPDAFHGWEPGDIFGALLELGAAWEEPGQGRGSPAARGLVDGSFEFRPDHVASGYALVAEWPTSFADLVERLRPFHTTATSKSGLAAKTLGVLGRHLVGEGPATPLRQLLSDAVETYASERAERTTAERLKVRETRIRLEKGLGADGGLTQVRDFSQGAAPARARRA